MYSPEDQHFFQMKQQLAMTAPPIEAVNAPPIKS